MPGVIENGEGAIKGKRLEPDQQPSKRARPESNEDVRTRIQLLENQILESKKNYNNIPDLINLVHARDGDLDTPIVASVALCRIFTRLIAAGDLNKVEGTTGKDTVVTLWLQQRYAEYKSELLQLLNLRASLTALTLCMRMLKIEGTYLLYGQDYHFPVSFLRDIVKILLHSETENSLRREFSEKYFEEYDDIRFYTFGTIESIMGAKSESQSSLVDQAVDLLAAVETVPETEDDLEDWYIPGPTKKSHVIYSLKAHKKHAQGAWLSVIKPSMDKDRRKRILGLVAASIVPWFNKPELLMDFLSDSYDTGGSTSLLALSGLFYLIQEKNLDYPSFYRKLYSLLDMGILHSKHRSRFFRLLDNFLASTHLPAVLVASFIKRLARLALNAPPSGIIAVVPWIYNLLKKHPTCTFMIHREIRGDEKVEQLENEGMRDPFVADEKDPMLTQAIDSSLWEIVTLQSHYHPNVATLANIISEQFTKQAYNFEDFLDHSYGSMLDSELSKEVKKPPVVEYEIPKKIFLKQDLDSGIEDSLLVKLWDFS